MRPHYYPVTLSAVRRELAQPLLKVPAEQIRHLQWMCGEIDTFDRSMDRLDTGANGSNADLE